mgnify:CR=1 FL=1
MSAMRPFELLPDYMLEPPPEPPEEDPEEAWLEAGDEQYDDLSLDERYERYDGL